MASGILIYPLFFPQAACPGTCIYCDQAAISGVSDTTDPAQMAIDVRDFVQRNPGREKQIAFYGGSFTGLPLIYRKQLMEYILPCLDRDSSIRISTHPLMIDEDILAWAKDNKIRTIELGVQDFADDVLAKSGRGYSGAQAIEACELIKAKGMELGVQLMPGLPGSSNQSIGLNMQRLREIRPKYLRIYPLIVIAGTPLEEFYRTGEYKALSLDQAIGICVDYLDLAEQLGITVIKIGLPSNLAVDKVISGPYHPAFGEFVMAERLIRRIVLDFVPDSAIILNERQRSLLCGHQCRFLRILEDRLNSCTLDIRYVK